MHVLHARRRAARDPREDLLTPDEIGRVVRVAVARLGITDVRFTGGEPLLRNDLADILRAARAPRRACPSR